MVGSDEIWAILDFGIRPNHDSCRDERVIRVEHKATHKASLIIEPVEIEAHVDIDGLISFHKDCVMDWVNGKVEVEYYGTSNTRSI